MDKVTLYNNTVEGVIGGASSIIPVILVSVMYGKISSVLYKDNPKNITIVAFAIFSLIFGIASGIVGGALADNNNDSIYNGIKYGSIVSNLVSLGGILAIKYS